MTLKAQPSLRARRRAAQKVLDQVWRARDAGALFVQNHSGGKDSQRSMLEVQKHIPPEQQLVVHATLGRSEWPGALEHARDQAAAVGVPFLVAQSSTHPDLLSMVRHRFQTRPEVPSWPGSNSRFCTSGLKRGPIEREVRRYAKARGITHIVNTMGIRGAESPRRAKACVWAANDSQSVAGRTWMNWLPIHGLSTEEVKRNLAAAGQQLHPAYTTGNDRLSCVFCVFARRGDLINGARQHPELYQEHVELERETGYTLHMSQRSLPEITGIE